MANGKPCEVSSLTQRPQMIHCSAFTNVELLILGAILCGARIPSLLCFSPTKMVSRSASAHGLASSRAARLVALELLLGGLPLGAASPSAAPLADAATPGGQRRPVRAAPLFLSGGGPLAHAAAAAAPLGARAATLPPSLCLLLLLPHLCTARRTSQGLVASRRLKGGFQAAAKPQGLDEDKIAFTMNQSHTGARDQKELPTTL